MPEGPEISYMVYTFNKKYNHSKLENIKVLSGRYSRHPLPKGFDDFLSKLPSKIENIKNKGKFIYITLENNSILGIKLNYGHLVTKFEKHCHIEITTSKGIFYIQDVRNFATLSFLNKDTLQEQLNKIGTDLLNEKVSLEEFTQKVKKHPRMKIGMFLIKQDYFSGVGNYVRSEALYIAKISPFRLNKDLSDDEIKEIYDAVLYILKKAFSCLKDHGKHIVKKVYEQKMTPNNEEVIREKLEPTRNIYWVPSVQK